MKTITISSYLFSVMDQLQVNNPIPIVLTENLSFEYLCSKVGSYNRCHFNNTGSYIDISCDKMLATLTLRTLKSEESTDDNIETDYMQTVNMESDEEIKQWENEKSGCVVFDDIGRRMELHKAEWYHRIEYKNELIHTGDEFLSVAVCDDACESEVLLTFSSKDDIRKLRDYLNNYLENNFEKK